MMSELLLHPRTAQALERHITKRSHAILVVGAPGAGKDTVLRSLASKLLGVDEAKLANQPYFKELYPDGKTLTIDQIRELQRSVTLKTTGAGDIKRVLVLHAAHSMNTEAQNALLKLLEEPPADTVLLLATDHLERMLPTIRSRVQIVQLLPIPKDQAMTYFVEKGHVSDAIARAYGVSGGQPGLMAAILENQQDNPLLQQIDTVKRLLQGTSYERLLMVDELSKDKDGVADLLLACKRICQGAMEQAALKDQQPATQAWHKRMQAAVTAEEALHKNANTKLLLTDLFLNL